MTMLIHSLAEMKLIVKHTGNVYRTTALAIHPVGVVAAIYYLGCFLNLVLMKEMCLFSFLF